MIDFLDIKTIDDLSYFLGLSPQRLKFIIYIMKDEVKYQEFKIYKRKKERVISSPCKILKQIQALIKFELEKIYKPRIAVYGFVKNRNIIRNAENHLYKKHILNIDLENFFPHINQLRLIGLFLTHPFNFNMHIAKLLAKICTHKGVLPQGAPTSPILSNMICYKMDAELTYLAKKSNATYTRYVDDMSFSFTCSKHKFREDILSFEDDNLILGGKLTNIITNNGFKINQKKVRLGSHNSRMEVTGLVVNEKLNVPRTYIRKIRILLNLWEKRGYTEAQEIFLTFPRSRRSKVPPSLEKSLYGMLIYLSNIIGIDSEVYYKLANRFNSLTLSLKLELQKPLNLRIKDALWIIETYYDNEYGAQMSQGTGFSINDGYIITAAHVILDELNRVRENLEVFKLSNLSKKFSLKVLNFDIAADVAICSIEENTLLKECLSLELDLQRVKGHKLKLLGFPDYHMAQTEPHDSSCDFMFFTTISTKTYFAINTPIIGGNSGGPIVTHEGKVIGIASKGYHGEGIIKDRDSSSIHVTIMGHNLCSCVNNIKPLLDQLIMSQTV